MINIINEENISVYREKIVYSNIIDQIDNYFLSYYDAYRSGTLQLISMSYRKNSYYVITVRIDKYDDYYTIHISQ